MRRELGLCLAAGVLGGGLMLLAAGQPWGPQAGGPAGGPGAVPVPSTPADDVNPIASLLSSLGAVVLLGAVVVAVTRTTGRRLAGVVVVVAAAAGAYVTADAAGGWSVWRLVAVLGALLGMLAGGLATARGPRWAGMSDRYDAPSTRRSSHDSDPWRRLDRGEDPTL